MKKNYITPATAVYMTAQMLPIAASLPIDNTPQNGIVGDVKAQGDWEIFDYGDEEE